MDLADYAQHLVSCGAEYGNTGEWGDRFYRKQGGRFWVYSSREKVYYFPCDDCGEWMSGATVLTRCQSCHDALMEQRRKAYKSRYNRAEYHRRQRERLLGPIDFTCVVCGQPFKAKRKSAKFCSGKCRQRHNRNKDEYQGKVAHPVWTEDDEVKLGRYREIHKTLCARPAEHVSDLDNRIAYYNKFIRPLLQRREYVERYVGLNLVDPPMV